MCIRDSHDAGPTILEPVDVGQQLHDLPVTHLAGAAGVEHDVPCLRVAPRFSTDDLISQRQRAARLIVHPFLLPVELRLRTGYGKPKECICS